MVQKTRSAGCQRAATQIPSPNTQVVNPGQAEQVNYARVVPHELCNPKAANL